MLCFSGVKVVGGKSELEKAMEKRKRQQQEQNRIAEAEEAKTDFQKVLEERAKKIDCDAKNNSSSSSSSNTESNPEFMKIHAQVNKGRSCN